jgi:uncharacterized protein (TIGR02271 family)
MKKDRPIIVKGRGGLSGSLAPGTRDPASRKTVRIHLDRGEEIEVPGEILVPQPDGSYYLDLGPEALDLHRVRAAGAGAQTEEVHVPVVQEKLEVGKRQVETGKVVVKKTVRARREVVDPTLLQEKIRIERVAVDRVVEGPVEIRQEGDVLIVPVLEETLVVEKRLILKEELHISRERAEARRPVEVTLLREEAQVERIDPPDRGGKRKSA